VKSGGENKISNENRKGVCLSFFFSSFFSIPVLHIIPAPHPAAAHPGRRPPRILPPAGVAAVIATTKVAASVAIAGAVVGRRRLQSAVPVGRGRRRPGRLLVTAAVVAVIAGRGRAGLVGAVRRRPALIIVRVRPGPAPAPLGKVVAPAGRRPWIGQGQAAAPGGGRAAAARPEVVRKPGPSVLDRLL
jgi:hypothetical protein